MPTLQLSEDEVLRLAPDESSAKAARGLTGSGQWPLLGIDDRAIWGECQGSGSKPYQVQVDQAGPAFKCSCPSRKFPCKHGLALLLIRAREPDRFKPASQPEWVGQWLQSRLERVEKERQKLADTGGTGTGTGTVIADPAAAAKREAARLQRMLAGADELEKWLADRVRQGLAALAGQGDAFEQMAVRMVDAQMPGLAMRLRQLAGALARQDPWHADVLSGMGRLQWMIDGLRRLDQLSGPVQADLRQALGMALERAEVVSEDRRQADTWWVLGQAFDEDGKIWTRRAWFQGQASQQRAMLIEHRHGARRLGHAFVTGSCVEAAFAFYPGMASQRVVLAGEAKQAEASSALAAGEMAEAFDQMCQAMAGNPWFLPRSLHFAHASLQRSESQWYLHSHDRRVPLRLSDASAEMLLALSGAHAATWFGEWDGQRMRPLTLWCDSGLWTEDGGPS